jgi:hypothetical protein
MNHLTRTVLLRAPGAPRNGSNFGAPDECSPPGPEASGGYHWLERVITCAHTVDDRLLFPRWRDGDAASDFTLTPPDRLRNRYAARVILEKLKSGRQDDVSGWTQTGAAERTINDRTFRQKAIVSVQRLAPPEPTRSPTFASTINWLIEKTAIIHAIISFSPPPRQQRSLSMQTTIIEEIRIVYRNCLALYPKLA